MQNVEIGVIWGLGITESPQQCLHSIEHIRLPIHL